MRINSTKKLGVFIVLLFMTIEIYSQVDREIVELETIYENLEYKTIAFDDLKKNWLIKDPILTREIFNRFIVNNGLYENGRRLRLHEIKKKAEVIYEDKAYVELKMRYYDNEIESIKFISETEAKKRPDKRIYLFDPIEDCVYIREILGDRVYNLIQSRSYSMNDITKDYFESNVGYYFDLYFNALDPEVMVWSTTSDYKNKYMVSIFGQWGNDKICVPGWYSTDLVMGVKLSYTDKVKKDRAITYYLYNIQLGSGFTAKQPFKDDRVRPRNLFNSGTNFYFKFSGNPLFFLRVENFQMGIEGLTTLEDKAYQDYKINYAASFYSMKNYLVFQMKQSRILNLFDFGELELGLGYATHDIYHFILDNAMQRVVMLEPKRDIMLPFFEVGVSREGGLLQHNVSITFNWNNESSYGWLAFRGMFMLSNTVGFDFRYFTAVGNVYNLPFWQSEGYYIVFSPIFRIVY